MNVLVLNIGSGSQKAALFRVDEASAEPRDPDWRALIDQTAPGQPEGRLVLGIHRRTASPLCLEIDASLSVRDRIEQMISALWDSDSGVLERAEDIDLVGHRVVHGGADHASAARIDDEVLATIEKYRPFAPLHNPANLAGIQIASRLIPAPQFAVFDTGFHHTLPEEATTYGGPYEWSERGLRRFGFHGTSFRWATHRAAEILERTDDPSLRLIICHLGGGCSLAATIGGRCIDTTMGCTPLDGLVMCTRSGSVDPGILLQLLREGTSMDELDDMLNHQSGLKGLSGISGDTRVLLPEIERGNRRAQLAMKVFIHRLRQGIGGMLATLGTRPDAIVFTDAIGEDEPFVRAAACKPFRFLGAEIDPAANTADALDADISTHGSRVRVLVVKGREEWQIARECVFTSENDMRPNRHRAANPV